MSVEQRKDLLKELSKAILEDRAATHGLPEQNFDSIAGFWSLYLHTRYGAAFLLDEKDVGIMMALLKVARSARNHEHLDNYIDGAGYMLLAGERYA